MLITTKLSLNVHLKSAEWIIILSFPSSVEQSQWSSIVINFNNRVCPKFLLLTNVKSDLDRHTHPSHCFDATKKMYSVYLSHRKMDITCAFCPITRQHVQILNGALHLSPVTAGFIRHVPPQNINTK